jgi:hypothetical protein
MICTILHQKVSPKPSLLTYLVIKQYCRKAGSKKPRVEEEGEKKELW